MHFLRLGLWSSAATLSDAIKRMVLETLVNCGYLLQEMSNVRSRCINEKRVHLNTHLWEKL